MRQLLVSSFRRVVAIAAAAALVVSCQASPVPVSQAPEAAAPTFAIDAAHVLDVLGDKPNTTWQDGLFNMAALRERRAAKGYRTQATAGSIPANRSIGAASSTPAYAHQWPDYPGPAPQAGDALFAVNDAGQVYKLNPASLAILAGPTASMGTFSGSAVLLSADNRNVYLLNTAGVLTILDASTLAVRSTLPLSGTGFSKIAPFIDYATSTVGDNALEKLWVVANDGTINRVTIDVEAGTAGKTSWTAASLGLGAITVNSFPFVWYNQAYFGATNGRFYAVNLNGAPSVKTWNLAPYTSATGTAIAINAPCAPDFDANLNVTDLFVPCGDRLCWIDVVANTVTPSNSLTLDKTTTTAGTLATYTPTATSTLSYTDTDYVSIKKFNSAPSRWGGSLGSVYNTGTQGTSVKFSANGASGAGEVWSANYSANSVSRLNLSGNIIGTYTTAAGANELCVDSGGNCWVTCTGGAKIDKVSPTGTVTVNTGLTNSTWPEVDSAGNVWVSTNGSNTINKYNAAGVLQFSKAVTRAFSVTVDTTDNCWVTSYTGNKAYRVTPTGTVSGGTTVGTTPTYIVTDPATGNLWVANNGSRTISIINPLTQTVIQTLPSTGTLPAGLWAINFDESNQPWTCHLTSGGVSQVNQINKSNGSVVTSYNMTAYGNCYEMCFDPSGTGWVATDQGIIRILNLGNLQDLFSADYFATASDADDSYSYVKFKIPQNAFGNQVPMSANLTLTANATTAGDTLDVYTASVTEPGGALWTGYPGTPNVDYNNRPAVVSPKLTTSTIIPFLNSSYAFNVVPVMSDQLNSADASNSQYAYAFRSTGKALGNVAHWYSNLSAGATTSRYPTLNVKVASTAKISTTAPGITCEPAVPGNGKVYVMSCNALWELDYSSPSAFQDPAKTSFVLSQTGRAGAGSAGGSPIVTTAPKTYIFPTGNVLLTPNGRAIAPDYNASSNKLIINDYQIPLNGAVDKLNYYVDANPGTGSVGRHMLYDFTSGHAYFTTTNGYVIRANILQ